MLTYADVCSSAEVHAEWMNHLNACIKRANMKESQGYCQYLQDHALQLHDNDMFQQFFGAVISGLTPFHDYLSLYNSDSTELKL